MWDSLKETFKDYHPPRKSATLKKKFHPDGLKMVFLHQIGLNKDQKGLRMYQQGLNIIMVYGFLDNVCGDFL